MTPVKTILISGASGLIGTYLSKYFELHNFKVIRLARTDFSGRIVLLAEKVAMADAVINLAGAPVIRRWTRKNMQQIYDSRILTTRKLVEAIALVKNKPRVMVSVSAVGIYDNKNIHDERSLHFDEGFLGKVCQDWEAEARKAEKYTSLAIVRLGVVLSARGGALKKMILPFKAGFGGKIGNGQQAFAWIHIADVVGAIAFIVKNPPAQGVFNLVAPDLINNYQFTKALGKVLGRPTIFTIHALVLRLLYGKAAITLTEGQQVLAIGLMKNGYHFNFPGIEMALADLLAAPPPLRNT